MNTAQSRLQQQPRRIMDRQQQQSSGSGEFQPRQPQQGGGARTNQADERRARQHPNGIES